MMNTVAIAAMCVATFGLGFAVGNRHEQPQMTQEGRSIMIPIDVIREECEHVSGSGNERLHYNCETLDIWLNHNQPQLEN
jgi:hypothetical protein